MSSHHHQSKNESTSTQTTKSSNPPTQEIENTPQHPELLRPELLTPKAVLKLQRIYGNQAVQRALGRKKTTPNNIQRRPTTTYDFSDEPAQVKGSFTKVGAGTTASQEIDNQIGDLKDHVLGFWTDYEGAVRDFAMVMQSKYSTQSVEAKYMEAAITSVGKYAFESMVGELKDKAGKAVPGLGHVVGVLLEVGKGIYEEGKRSAEAKDVVLIRDHMLDLLGDIDKKRKAMIDKVIEQRKPLKDDYFKVTQAEQAAGGTSGDATKEGTIVGAGADYIKALTAAVNGFKVKSPSRGVMLQKMVEDFALQGKSHINIYKDFTQGNYMHIEVLVYKEGQKWKVDHKDSAWTLVTTMPDPDKIADALSHAMKLQGKKPYDSNISKMVHLKVEDEVDWAINDWYDGVIDFKESPDKKDIRGWKNAKERAYVEAAWEIKAKEAVLGVTKLKGSSGDK